MPKRKTAGKPSRASSSPKKAHYAGSEKRMTVGSPELRKLIISQVCNGRRRTGFGYYWEFPHRGRPMTLATRKK